MIYTEQPYTEQQIQEMFIEGWLAAKDASRCNASLAGWCADIPFLTGKVAGNRFLRLFKEDVLRAVSLNFKPDPDMPSLGRCLALADWLRLRHHILTILDKGD